MTRPIALLFLLVGGSARADTLADLREAWKQYEPFAAKLNGTCTTVDFNRETGQYNDKSTNTITKAPGYYCEQQTDLRQQIPDAVYGWNPSYAFELSKFPPGQPWYQKQFVLAPAYKELPLFQGIAERIKFNGPFYLFEGSLPQMASEPGFVVKGIEDVELHGQPMVKLTFQYKPISGKRPLERSGSVWLKKDNDFRPVSYFEVLGEWSKTDTALIKGEVSMTATIDGVPIVRKETLSFLKGDRPIRDLTREYDYAFDKADKALCYLSHYGLEEPVSNTSWVEVVVWIGFAFILTAAALFGFAILRSKFAEHRSEPF